MKNMENRLIKIESENWSRLRALYLPETPATILGLTTINNYIRWNLQGPKIDNLAIYSLNGDWSDGLFVVVDRYHLYFDSLSESNTRLLELLDLLDYSKGFRIMHIRSTHYAVALEIIKRKQLILEYDDPNLLYYLPGEQAIRLKCELPYNFYSLPLSYSDVIKANSDWPFKHDGSLFFLNRLAQLNPSCGIFSRAGNELVSSVFQLQTGPVGTLNTKPCYRGQCFGTAAIKTIFKAVADLGFGVTACVKSTNMASRAIFEKIGCQIIDEIHWIAIPCEWDEGNDNKSKSN